MDKLLVGNIYEIDPYIKMDVGSHVIGARFYAKLIGFNSDDKPVFEKGKDYICCGEDSAKITAIKDIQNKDSGDTTKTPEEKL